MANQPAISVWDSNLRPPSCEAEALTTRPPQLIITTFNFRARAQEKYEEDANDRFLDSIDSYLSDDSNLNEPNLRGDAQYECPQEVGHADTEPLIPEER